MNRAGHDNVEFFTGTEVERTPAFGKTTLFVVGLQSIDNIAAKMAGCEHIYSLAPITVSILSLPKSGASGKV
jgi:hypothetical protein